MTRIAYLLLCCFCLVVLASPLRSEEKPLIEFHRINGESASLSTHVLIYSDGRVHFTSNEKGKIDRLLQKKKEEVDGLVKVFVASGFLQMKNPPAVNWDRDESVEKVIFRHGGRENSLYMKCAPEAVEEALNSFIDSLPVK